MSNEEATSSRGVGEACAYVLFPAQRVADIRDFELLPSKFNVGKQFRALARERLNCSGIRFFSDGSADLVNGPINPVVERAGRRAWIVSIIGYTDNIDMVSNEFGDGSGPFPSSAVDAYREILAENCVDIKWQKGDVLLVDNFAVQHARRPGKPPRRVLVSMCK